MGPSATAHNHLPLCAMGQLMCCSRRRKARHRRATGASFTTSIWQWANAIKLDHPPTIVDFRLPGSWIEDHSRPIRLVRRSNARAGTSFRARMSITSRTPLTGRSPTTTLIDHPLNAWLDTRPRSPVIGVTLAEATAIVDKQSIPSKPESSLSIPPLPSNRDHTWRVWTKECVVCRDSLPKTSFPERLTTATCHHPNNICSSCIARHIEVEVIEKGQVNCPSPRCKKALAYLDVQHSADPEVFERYDRFLLQKDLQSDPNFKYCKNPQCGSGQIHEEGSKSPLMICHSCNTKSCFSHEVPKLPGKFALKLRRAFGVRKVKPIICDKCGENLDGLIKDAASTKYIKANTKPCPGCQRPIEKSAGCDHMTCRKPAGCGHQFCWVCLAPFGPISQLGNHHHDSGCLHYRPS